MTDLRSAADHHDRILELRLEALIPHLMDRAGLDAWVITGREYNEGPVLATMLPSTWLGNARRRTVLLFTDGGRRRLAVSRYAAGSFEPAWDPQEQPDQWARVAELLSDADPGRIGVNTSPTFALADGISATELAGLTDALPATLRGRIVSAEPAAIGWLETRLAPEVEIMGEACAVSHRYLARALSPEVVKPGETTTADVEWWLRSAVHADGHRSGFHPMVSVQREGAEPRTSFSTRPEAVTIEPGDLVHIDFGILYRGYCTDQQQHAYVLLPDENEAPAGLAAGLRDSNRLQDLLRASFLTGRTGNDILASTLDAAEREGVDGLVYTHPIGVHVHAGGPTIGLWDQQHGVPGSGNYPVWPDTAYSIELQTKRAVEEWDDQIVGFMLEEDAFFDGSEVRWLDGRQTRLHLI